MRPAPRVSLGPIQPLDPASSAEQTRHVEGGLGAGPLRRWLEPSTRQRSGSSRTCRTALHQRAAVSSWSGITTRRPGLLEGPRVGALVLTGVGIGHQHHGPAEAGHLGEGASPGAHHHQAGCGQPLGDVGDEWRGLVAVADRQTGLLCGGNHLGVVGGAGQVDHGQLGHLRQQERHRLQQHLLRCRAPWEPPITSRVGGASGGWGRPASSAKRQTHRVAGADDPGTGQVLLPSPGRSWPRLGPWLPATGLPAPAACSVPGEGPGSSGGEPPARPARRRSPRSPGPPEA